MKEEEWRDIAGYEGSYEISSQGRIRSVNYRHTGRTQVLKPMMDGRGYLQVWLYKDGKAKSCKLHRLVAQTFLSNPENLPEVNHIDENKQNNAVTNLEWCDRLYNMRYGTGIGRMAAAKGKPVQQFSKDGVLVAFWPSIKEAERATGINKGHICECCNGKYHTAGGFIWQYA